MGALIAILCTLLGKKSKTKTCIDADLRQECQLIFFTHLGLTNDEYSMDESYGGSVRASEKCFPLSLPRGLNSCPRHVLVAVLLLNHYQISQ